MDKGVEGEGEEMKNKKKVDDGFICGFFPVSATKIEWKSRKKSASGAAMNSDKAMEAVADNNTPDKKEEISETEKVVVEPTTTTPVLSERRKALFEPLEPARNVNGKRPSAEALLPPPDFEFANYPKGWLIGKKRKLVNVDVVESMRRIAVQEMNRKDREIDGLNEQLEEDARCLEHLQIQLLQERSKRAEVEREKAMLQEQVDMLMNMFQEEEEEEVMENEAAADEP